MKLFKRELRLPDVLGRNRISVNSVGVGGGGEHDSAVKIKGCDPVSEDMEPAKLQGNMKILCGR